MTLNMCADEFIEHVDFSYDESANVAPLEMHRLVICGVDLTLHGITEFEHRADNLSLDPVALEKDENEWIPRMGLVLRLSCHYSEERQLFSISLFPYYVLNLIEHLILNLISF